MPACEIHTALASGAAGEGPTPTQDLARAFAADGAAWRHLRIDGGMSANNWLAKDLADMLAIPVERPADVETTALGAAMLAFDSVRVFQIQNRISTRT